MAATAKQLAALKKARAARKRNLRAAKKPATAKRKPVKRKPIKRKPIKRKVARKKNPAPKKNYLYVAKTTTGTKYWFTGDDFSDSKKDAKSIGHTAAMNAAQKLRSRKALKGFNFYYTGAIVKKHKGGAGKNPVPPSKRVKIKEASELYSDFSGHEASHLIKTKHSFPDVGVYVGELDGVLYTTVRDGKTESYIHKFKDKSRPILATSFDGKKLAVIGGRYQFTNRGIEDR